MYRNSRPYFLEFHHDDPVMGNGTYIRCWQGHKQGFTVEGEMEVAALAKWQVNASEQGTLLHACISEYMNLVNGSTPSKDKCLCCNEGRTTGVDCNQVITVYTDVVGGKEIGQVRLCGLCWTRYSIFLKSFMVMQ